VTIKKRALNNRGAPGKSGPLEALAEDRVDKTIKPTGGEKLFKGL
jgi:hypothetical protein